MIDQILKVYADNPRVIQIVASVAFALGIVLGASV